MRKRETFGCLFLTVIVLGVALGLVLGLKTLFTSPASYAPEKARKLAAEANRVELENATYARSQDARVAALTILFIGGATVLVLGGVGATVVGIRRGLTWAGRVYPNAAGQLPLVHIGGPGWTGYLDPNRSAGPVTIIGGNHKAGTLAIQQPLALSEPASLQLTAQATALGMTAAATRHPTSSRANVMGAVESVAVPRVSLGSRPLPQVETIDPSHIDRLLLLTDGEGDVTEGDYREL